VLALLQPHPRVIALWRPRFERFARWFAETEPGRRQGMKLDKTEVGGAHVIEAPGGPFRLTARADRIEMHDRCRPGGRPAEQKSTWARRAGRGCAPDPQRMARRGDQ
jgi:hypothetical protein